MPLSPAVVKFARSYTTLGNQGRWVVGGSGLHDYVGMLKRQGGPPGVASPSSRPSPEEVLIHAHLRLLLEVASVVDRAVSVYEMRGSFLKGKTYEQVGVAARKLLRR